MTRRLATMCFMAMLLIGFTSPSIQAEDNELTRATLKGIKAVFVVVEDLPPGAKVLGLSKDTIQTDVELKLRLAGMPVVTREESLNFRGTPFVYIRVNLSDNAEAASIDIELRQGAILLSNSQITVGITSWSKGLLTLTPTSQHIRDKLKDLVDQFLNAWLSVNPKR